jgi:serine/threonine-protein phosphatase 6 regulatory subunit 3
MLAFIQSQPSVVGRLLRHVETPPFVDLLLRIIQLDENPNVSGVLEVRNSDIKLIGLFSLVQMQWLSAENLMGRLIDLLSSAHPSDVHAVVAETIKGIISMAAPSPGAGLTEGLQNGPASNRFARELARPESILRLADYILIDFNARDDSFTFQDAQKSPADATLSHEESSQPIPPKTPPLPNAQSATSSVVQSVGIIIELIRKNNSDYFEPYLFHTLRNRLIQVQQHLQHSEDGREALERAMKDMVDRMGVVHLGPMLEIMYERLGSFQQYLRCPRSSVCFTLACFRTC